MAQRATMTVASSATGVVVRIEGAGTMTESPVVHGFAEQVLRDGERRVVICLADCAYVDSTFLGGLVSLFRRHGARGRFAIHAPEPRRRTLFGVSRLDRILPFVDELPPIGPDHLPLEAHGPSAPDELARYIADCHRRLAELGGPEAPEFARVADAITAELEAGRRR